MGFLGGRNKEGAGKETITEIATNVPEQVSLHLSRIHPISRRAFWKKTGSQTRRLVEYLKPKDKKTCKKEKIKPVTAKEWESSCHMTSQSLQMLGDNSSSFLWSSEVKNFKPKSITSRLLTERGRKRRFPISRLRRHITTWSLWKTLQGLYQNSAGSGLHSFPPAPGEVWRTVKAGR